MPALDSDMAEVIMRSELIVKAHAQHHSLTETAINDLIAMRLVYVLQPHSVCSK